MDEQTVMMWVAVLGLLLTIVGAIIQIIRVMFNQAQQLLVSPLVSQIASLGEKINSLGLVLNNLKEELAATRERLAKVEASTKSAHHRLDAIDGQLHEHFNGGV